MLKHTNYLYRTVVVLALSTLASVLPANVITEDLLPMLLPMAEDPVANIRMNVAKAMKEFIRPLEQATVDEKLKPVLHKLLHDGDRDVRFYASAAIQETSS